MLIFVEMMALTVHFVNSRILPSKLGTIMPDYARFLRFLTGYFSVIVLVISCIDLIVFFYDSSIYKFGTEVSGLWYARKENFILLRSMEILLSTLAIVFVVTKNPFYSYFGLFLLFVSIFIALF